jgi:hypothetical protein
MEKVARRTLRIRLELMAELESAAERLNCLDRSELQFRRRSGRAKVSPTELAHVALEMGLDEVLAEHGLGPEIPELDACEGR